MPKYIPGSAKRALIVNCSTAHYNLATHKLFNWLTSLGVPCDRFDGDPGLWGFPVESYDLVCLSVIFSWDAPLAANLANRYKDTATIWSGGPGLVALGKWWAEKTDCPPPMTRIDDSFDRQRGDYEMTFASRGCPVGCYFCVVPQIEGTDFSLDWEFQPAPILCDNNLSALPVDFQNHIIRRYQKTRTRLVDANSGFEPRTFDAGTYARWKPIMRGPWRLAYDTTDEGPYIERALEILSPIPRYSSKMIYCLIGNEPIASCWKRAISIIDWGGCPYVQPMIPLNALTERGYKVAYDWDLYRLSAFTRYFNRYLWRIIPIEEYRHNKNESIEWPDDVYNIKPRVFAPKYKTRQQNTAVLEGQLGLPVIYRSSSP